MNVICPRQNPEGSCRESGGTSDVVQLVGSWKLELRSFNFLCEKDFSAACLQ